MKMRTLLFVSLAAVMGLVLAGCGSGSSTYTADHARSFVYIYDNNSVNAGAIISHLHQPMTAAQRKASRMARVHKLATRAASTGVDIASGSMDLYLYDMTTNKSTKLNGAYGSLAFETVSMGAYGTKLLFSAYDSKGYVQVFLADAKLRTITQLTTDENDHFDAQISIDGNWVAFDNDDGTLYYMSASGGTATAIKINTSIVALSYAWNPSFTPDNKSLVFSGNLEDSDGEFIFSAKLDGTGLTQLTNPDQAAEYDYYNSVSPDGSTLAFTREIYSEEYGWQENIYTVSISGESASNVASQLTTDGYSWYPLYFGTKILFLDYGPNYYGTGNDNIFSMGIDGSSITQLTNTPYETTFNDLYY
jgi:hypothetical protein